MGDNIYDYAPDYARSDYEQMRVKHFRVEQLIRDVVESECALLERRELPDIRAIRYSLIVPIVQELLRPEVVQAKWPADWWQAFKERWFPMWALRRWPVRCHELHREIERYKVCPHLAVDPQRKHISFMCQDEE